MEAEKRRDSSDADVMQGHLGQTSSRREVPDLISWLQCFSSYAAVVCRKHPEKMRELWAYQALMISEFCGCGGRGWQLYDTAFRQHAASLEFVDFSKINQGLYATTFLALRGERAVLSKLHVVGPYVGGMRIAPKQVGAGDPYWGWISEGSKEEVRMPWGQERRRPPRGACFAWNDGRCSTPCCRFSHFCSRCGSSDHRKPQCHTHLEPDRRGKE